VTFGMGGPVAYGIFPVVLALYSSGNFSVSAAGVIASTASCLGIALSVLLFKKKYTPDERSGVVGLLTGFACSVTEFQIPYFIKDLKTFVPCLILAGATGGAMVGLLEVTLPAIHGGLFVAPLANNVPLYLLCILAQAGVTLGYIAIFKKNLPPEESLVHERGDASRSILGSEA
jgi:PTS system fructose-specific IIC component